METPTGLEKNLPALNPGEKYIYRGTRWESGVKIDFVYYEGCGYHLHRDKETGPAGGHYWEVVPMTFEEKLEEAKKLIGKEIAVGSSKFKVDAVEVCLAGENRASTYALVRDHAKKHGYCIYVSGDSRRSSAPYEVVKIVPEIKTKEINELISVSSNGNVQVGTNNLTIKEIENILAAHKELTKPVEPKN